MATSIREGAQWGQRKLNCWEFKKCGREPGGAEAARQGVCPAATFTVTDGLNSGLNGGRICWAVAGTFCSNVEGTFARKIPYCTWCDFFLAVVEEEFMPRPNPVIHDRNKREIRL